MSPPEWGWSGPAHHLNLPEAPEALCNTAVPSDRAGSRLMELASAEMCSARCPHCGALNTFRGFTAIEAYNCRECGEGVDVGHPVR